MYSLTKEHRNDSLQNFLVYNTVYSDEFEAIF